MKTLRFLADSMLGKLARWLRILGYDTAYSSGQDDTDLLKIAFQEDRVLVTRDKGLHRRALSEKIKTHFLEPGSLSEWLESLSERLGLVLALEEISPRCSLCNRLLSSASKEIILKTVPTRIQRVHPYFWHCPDCEKTYWQGTHWENMRAFLTSVSKSRLGGL